MKEQEEKIDYSDPELTIDDLPEKDFFVHLGLFMVGTGPDDEENIEKKGQRSLFEEG